MIQLRLLTEPKNPQRHEAHHVHDQPRGERCQAMPQIVLIVHGFHRGHTQIQHQQGHREGKDAIAEGREALHTLPGNPVIRRGHGV